MQQIRIERKAPIRERPDRSTLLPLDPRDPDIMRAKLLHAAGPTEASLRDRVRRALSDYRRRL